MQNYFEEIKKWQSNNNNVAIARVIKTWGSSPRPVGSVMLVNEEGKMAGSVSGGCVEGSVVKKSLEIIEAGTATKLAFGVSDEDAWSVGLSCGGSIQVFLENFDLSAGSIWSTVMDSLDKNESCTLISSLEEGQNRSLLIKSDGSQLGENMPEPILEAAAQAYQQRASTTTEHEGVAYFIQVFPRKPTLMVIGAAHITVDLVSLGHTFGFETVVIDPRGYFAQNTVFPDPPSQLLEEYPSEVLEQFPLDPYTFCAILSHDPKIDDNALEILLPSEVAYIGALGSKKTHAKRTARLLEKGIDQMLIDKIHAPIGVSIHAKSAREIALSIISQIIQVKNQHL